MPATPERPAATLHDEEAPVACQKCGAEMTTAETRQGDLCAVCSAHAEGYDKGYAQGYKDAEFEYGP